VTEKARGSVEAAAGASSREASNERPRALFGELRAGSAEPVAVAARFTLYSLAILVMMLSLPLVAKSSDGFLFREGGPVEWAQFILLVATSVLCLVSAAWRPAWRGCLLALATAAGLAAVRELDSTLDRAIRFGGWKLPFALLLLVGAVAVYRHRASLRRGLIPLLSDRSFALFWCGLVIAIPFAQLAGHGPFLELVLGDAYDRSQKRLFEELGELIGYVLIFLGAIEVLLASRARAQPLPSARRVGSVRRGPPPS
jgi:hypothetical protein